MATIETDYLVVGGGAAGMAFVDSLITECEADVVMVDDVNARADTGTAPTRSCACINRPPSTA
jgi:succinate dehydrogenase/fumarate reductase flavoprotein subunit